MPSSAQLTKPRYSFANGTLRIARDAGEMRIAAHPVPRAAMRRGGSGEWENFLPEFRLVHPYRPTKKNAASKPTGPQDQLCFGFLEETESTPRPKPLTPSQQKKRAFDQFRFSLPKPVANAVEPFRTHQWPFLVFLHHDPGAIDLAESNPVLAFVLAQRMKADREMFETLRCSSMRQRELLDLLDLPSSKRAVGLFRKLSPASVTGDNWDSIVRLLRRELENPKSTLGHLNSINSGVVEILLDTHASRAATPNLLKEVARNRAENYRGRVVHMITSTLRMQEELRSGRPSGGQRAERFPNVARLEAVHQEVSENYRRRVRQLIDAEKHESDSFRSPPLPGIEGKIEPITSATGLVDEGEAQGNCVASYAARVRDGRTFIYRVLHPERATLSLVRKTPFSEWQIGELEGRYNTDASQETEDFVQAWLDRHRSVL